MPFNSVTKLTMVCHLKLITTSEYRTRLIIEGQYSNNVTIFLFCKLIASPLLIASFCNCNLKDF